MFRKILPAALLVAACATPREQCISNASQEIRTLNGLISTTRANVERGFALETRTTFVNQEQVCGQDAKGKDIMCEIPVAEERQVPVAIDLVAEEAKLQSLLQRRAEAEVRRNRAVQQCIAVHPE